VARSRRGARTQSRFYLEGRLVRVHNSWQRTKAIATDRVVRDRARCVSRKHTFCLRALSVGPAVTQRPVVRVAPTVWRRSGALRHRAIAMHRCIARCIAIASARLHKRIDAIDFRSSFVIVRTLDAVELTLDAPVQLVFFRQRLPRHAVRDRGPSARAPAPARARARVAIVLLSSNPRGAAARAVRG
jgi:hypothetical protein